MTAAELIGFMASLSASPEAADGEATPGEEEGGTGAPSWYDETEIAGGVYAPAGETAYAVINRSAGETGAPHAFLGMVDVATVG